MKVVIENFCKYSSYEVEFKSLKVCLLEGASGDGKTTIFEAIKFCLYGICGNIYPIGQPGTSQRKTKVEITLPEHKNIVITRSKPPEVLEIKIRKKQITGNAAQEYIYKIFGDLNSFLATSYLPQGNRHPLLALSNKEKLELLTQLTFGIDSDDHPDKLLKNTEDHSKKIIKKLDTKLTQEQMLVKQLSSEYQEFSPSDVETIDQGIEDLSSQISSLQKEITQVQKLENQQQHLNKLIKDISKELEKVPDYDLAEIERLSELISIRERYLKISKVDPVDNPGYDLQDLEETQRRLLEIQKLELKLEKLEVYPFTENQIYDEIKFRELTSKIKEDYQQIPILNSEYTISKLGDYKEAIVLLSKIPKIYWRLPQGSYLEFMNAVLTKPKKYQSLEIDLEEVEEKISSQKIYKKEQEICSKLGIEYDLESCQNYLSEIETHVKNQEIYRKFKKVKEIIDKLTPEESKYISIINKHKHLSEKYEVTDPQQLEYRQGKTLECPCCREKLILKDSSLTKYQADPIPDEDLESLKIYFQKISSLENLKMDKYRADLSELLEGPIYTDKDLTEILSNLEEIRNFKYPQVDDSYDWNLVKKSVEWRLELKRYTRPPEEVLEDPKYRTNLQNYVYIQNEIQKLDLNIPFEELQVAVSQIEDYQNAQEYFQIKDEISRLSLHPELSKIKDLKNLLVKYNKNSTIREQYLQQIKELSEIENPYPEVNLEEAIFNTKKYYQYQEYLSKIKELEITDLSELDLVDGITQEYLREQTKLNHKRQTLTTQMINLKTEYEQITIKKSSEMLRGELQELQEKHSELLFTLDHSQKCLKIAKKRAKINQLEMSRNASLRIKELISNVRNTVLKDFIVSFNSVLNQVLGELFSENMTVKLRLEKQNKSNHKVRQVVNFGIYYKGYEFDNPNILSGGERDRLSLAILIALAYTNGSKIVMLDECLASLNEELRLICIKTINKYLPHKTVINVCHSVTQGYHDEVVSV